MSLQIMVANGLALLGLTFAFPPYFGPGASTDPSTLLQSGANRLRCSVDIGVLWVYVCSLAATLLHSNDDGGPPCIEHRQPSLAVLSSPASSEEFKFNYDCVCVGGRCSFFIIVII